ncbi:hypothetical protein B0H11DRAFT_2019363 [Mycena galericulata]|nr:hypothetical protein B0H11DRAFT_2019363 [Mycena galericulata]
MYQPYLAKSSAPFMTASLPNHGGASSTTRTLLVHPACGDASQGRECSLVNRRLGQISGSGDSARIWSALSSTYARAVMLIVENRRLQGDREYASALSAELRASLTVVYVFETFLKPLERRRYLPQSLPPSEPCSSCAIPSPQRPRRRCGSIFGQRAGVPPAAAEAARTEGGGAAVALWRMKAPGAGRGCAPEGA